MFVRLNSATAHSSPSPPKELCNMDIGLGTVSPVSFSFSPVTNQPNGKGRGAKEALESQWNLHNFAESVSFINITQQQQQFASGPVSSRATILVWSCLVSS